MVVVRHQIEEDKVLPEWRKRRHIPGLIALQSSCSDGLRFLVSWWKDENLYKRGEVDLLKSVLKQDTDLKLVQNGAVVQGPVDNVVLEKKAAIRWSTIFTSAIITLGAVVGNVELLRTHGAALVAKPEVFLKSSSSQFDVGLGQALQFDVIAQNQNRFQNVTTQIALRPFRIEDSLTTYGIEMFGDFKTLESSQSRWLPWDKSHEFVNEATFTLGSGTDIGALDGLWPVGISVLIPYSAKTGLWHRTLKDEFAVPIRIWPPKPRLALRVEKPSTDENDNVHRCELIVVTGPHELANQTVSVKLNENRVSAGWRMNGEDASADIRAIDQGDNSATKWEFSQEKYHKVILCFTIRVPANELEIGIETIINSLDITPRPGVLT